MNKLIKMASNILFYILVFITLALTTGRLVTEFHSRSKIYQAEDVPPSRAAIVFGAGLTNNGTPTAVLQDRVSTAVDLYKAGKVEKILMSGDNRFVDYNEPGAMFNYAVSLGVPAEDIILDYAGRRTYDTCYRAGYIFGLKEAILVTQKFHLPRAIYTCNMLGVNARGVIADQRQYVTYSHEFWKVRETCASLTALWDIWIAKPLPVLGKFEPIFPPSDYTQSRPQSPTQASSSPPTPEDHSGTQLAN